MTSALIQDPANPDTFVNQAAGSNPRVLLSAYQCGPGMGSVSQIGWHWYSRLAKRLLAARLLAPLLALRGLMQRLQRLWAWALLRAQIGSLSPDCVVLGSPEIHGTRRIECGQGLLLYRELHLETQDQGRIRIGDRVVISRGAHIVAFTDLEIGAGTMIGEYASIRDANHRYDATQSLRDSGHVTRKVRIGNEVWIGRGAAILPGVSIGDRAVIGANAVVTRDVAPGAVVAGVPARAIKHGAGAGKRCRISS